MTFRRASNVLSALISGVVFASAAPAFAQDSGLPPLPPIPEVGKQAPSLSVEEIVRAHGIDSALPSALDRKSLAGKVVIVEFWATWCAPCIGSIPHLNDLAAAFRDAPVVFVSVTDEPREKVEPFLAKREIDGVVALDTDRSVFLSYRIGAIPRTVIIDSKGVIRAMMHPSGLTQEVIQDVLEGRPVQDLTAAVPEQPPSPPVLAQAQTQVLPAEDASPQAPSSTPAPAPSALPGEVLYEVSVHASSLATARVERGAGSIVATGCTARELLAECQSVSPGAIIVEGSLDLDAPRYDAAIRLPPATTSPQRTRDVLEDALEQALGFRAARERQILPVLVLRQGATAPPPGLRASQGAEGGSSLSWGLGTVSGIRQPISALAERLGAMVKMPIVDETGLQGAFDWTVHCADDSVDAVSAALGEQIGLRAEVQTRKLEVVVVRAVPR